MSHLSLALRACVAWAIAAAVASHQMPRADAQLFPPATGIAPGDVVMRNGRDGWTKYDPASNLLFSLNWDDSFFDGPFAFDIDGAILKLPALNSGAAFLRIHPVTGAATNFGPAPIPRLQDFDITPIGDLIITQRASNSRRMGDVWEGGTDGRLLRYSRQAGQLTNYPKPAQFSPNTVAVGSSGEAYINEFFRDLMEVDLVTGELTDLDAPSSFFGELELFPDGDLCYPNMGFGLLRLDIATGMVTPLAANLPRVMESFTVDDQGQVWASTFTGLYLIDGTTGIATLKADFPSFTAPSHMAVVPSNWTAPPVPEPDVTTLATAAAAGVSVTRRRRGGNGLSA